MSSVWRICLFLGLWAATASAAAPVQDPPGTRIKFDNGAFLGNSQQGFICVPTDLNRRPVAEGTETLTVGVGEGNHAKVTITSGRDRFYFQGQPDAVSIEKVAGADGTAKFVFAAMASRGPATLKIEAIVAGTPPILIAEPACRSFILIPELVGPTTTDVSLVIGQPEGQLNPVAIAIMPANRFFLRGGSMVSDVTAVDNNVVRALGDIRIQTGLTISPMPVDAELFMRMESRTLTVERYQQFVDVTAGPFTANVPSEDDAAAAGWKVKVVTSGITGIPGEVLVPASGEFDGAVVPQDSGRIAPPTILRLTARAQQSNSGPAVDEKTVTMRALEVATTLFLVSTDAQARGEGARARGQTRTHSAILQLLPKCPF